MTGLVHAMHPRMTRCISKCQAAFVEHATVCFNGKRA